MKAVIKILTAGKQFTPDEMDCFRRMLNVFHERGLSARLEIKVKQTYDFKSIPKMKAV